MARYRAIAPNGQVLEREDPRDDMVFAKLVCTYGNWTLYALRATELELSRGKAFVKGNREFCIVYVEKI